MGNDLHFYYAGGFFAWLFALAIAIAVIVWIGWLILIGLAVIAVIGIASEIRARRARS